MAVRRKRATHEDRLREWAAAHDNRSVIVSHDAQRWSLILVGPRSPNGGRRHHVGVKCETLRDAIERALEQWEVNRG